MVKYFKTNGIYSNADMLRVEVKYDKGNGYVAVVNPVHKDKYSWSIIYCREYYQHYNTLSCMFIPCKRRSEKKEQEANEMLLEKLEWLVEQYVNMAYNKGGRYIEVVGEYTED